MKNKMSTNLFMAVLLFFIGLCWLASAVGGKSAPSKPTLDVPAIYTQAAETVMAQYQPTKTPNPTPTEMVWPTSILLPTTEPTETNIPAPQTTIRTGTFLVGVDMEPGTYKGIAGDDLFGSCYWARLSGLDGSLGSIIANGNATGQFYVEILPSDYAFELHGCEMVKVR